MVASRGVLSVQALPALIHSRSRRYVIAHNQVIDYWRNAKSKGSLHLDESLLSHGIDPEEVAEVNMDINRLVQALGQITKAQREVTELRFAVEVAKIVGKSQGAVKTLQHNELVTLRKSLSVSEQA
jgi:DNA-directed RNA polymerase specialized sigma24 family protein